MVINKNGSRWSRTRFLPVIQNSIFTQIHWCGFWSTIKHWGIIALVAELSINWTNMGHFGDNSGCLNDYQTGGVDLQVEIGQ